MGVGNAAAGSLFALCQPLAASAAAHLGVGNAAAGANAGTLLALCQPGGPSLAQLKEVAAMASSAHGAFFSSGVEIEAGGEENRSGADDAVVVDGGVKE